MGNEASLEGGEGTPSGLPEGLAPDGKGGFVRVPEGTPVNLGELTEEQRRQLAAAMSRAQGRQPGGAAAARRPSESDGQQRYQQTGASRGQSGLSKSRTVDTFNQGPPGKAPPGRSPSSLSLFESRFRQEPKDPDHKPSGMFGSSFFSGSNPLSAVSSMTSSVSSSISSMGDSVTMPKLGLFGDDEDGDSPAAPESKQGGRPPSKGPQQGPGPRGPQQGGPQKQGQGPPGQGPKPGQGPPGQGPRQGQGPPGQGPKSAQGSPGPGPKQGQGQPGHGPRAGQGPPGQGPPGQGPRQGQGPPGQKDGPSQQGPGKPAPKQGPPGPGVQPGEQPKSGGPGGGVCPLCKTTKLNVGSKDPPNYNCCTECKNQVCSLCGFSPPDSAGKEWLCLNCQMQRAMGAMDAPGPKPKQGSAPPSPQRQPSGKPEKLLIKQQSTSDQGLTPPSTPRQKSPGHTSPGPLSPSSSVGGSPKVDPKTGRPIQPKSSPQPSPAKAKQESSFFGGFSLGGLADSVKPSASAPQAADSVAGKLFGGFGSKAQAAPKQEESVAGKLFGGFSGMTESPKAPAAASQMFTFGSSLLTSATNIVTGEASKAEESPPGSPPDSPVDSGPGSPPDSGAGSPPDSPFSPPGSPPDSDSAPDTPTAKSKKPPRTISVEREEERSVPPAAGVCETCPLCQAELNVGSAEPPNHSWCTQCKRNICNLCGFNPTPHLGENEWLCLHCQTQRAGSGQLGDPVPPATASPKKQPPAPAPAPAPGSSSTPAAVDSNPVVKPPPPPAPEAKVVPLTLPEPDAVSSCSVSACSVSSGSVSTSSVSSGSVSACSVSSGSVSACSVSTCSVSEPFPDSQKNLQPKEQKEAFADENVSEVKQPEPSSSEPQEPLPDEGETENQSTIMGFDATAASTEVEGEPQVSQSGASPRENLEVEPEPETGPDVAEEPRSASTSDAVLQEVPPQMEQTSESTVPTESLIPAAEEEPEPAGDGSGGLREATPPPPLLPPSQDEVAELVENVDSRTAEAQKEPKPDSNPADLEEPQTSSESKSLRSDGELQEPEPPEEVKDLRDGTEPSSEENKISAEEESVELKIPQRVDEEIKATENEEKTRDKVGEPVQMEAGNEEERPEASEEQLVLNNAASETVNEEKANEGKLSEEERTEEEKTHEQKADEEKVDGARRSRTPSVPAPTATDETPEDETLKTLGTETQTASAADSEKHRNRNPEELAQMASHVIPAETGEDALIRDGSESCSLQTNGEEVQRGEERPEGGAQERKEGAPPVQEILSEREESKANPDEPETTERSLGDGDCGVAEAEAEAGASGAEAQILLHAAEQQEKEFQEEKAEREESKANPDQPETTERSFVDADGGGAEAEASEAETQILLHAAEQQEKEFQGEKTEREEPKEAENQAVGRASDGETVAEQVRTAESVKEPGEKLVAAKEPSPTSPSDLAKLESTVLPILEAQASPPSRKEEKPTDTLKTRRKLEVLPLSPDSASSEDDREPPEVPQTAAKKKLLVPMDVRPDSLDDSSESFGKESPLSGDDEEFIRKQIVEMSENEDASPSDEESPLRRKIREDGNERVEERKTEAVERSASGKARRLVKRSTISPDDEEEKQLSLDKPEGDGKDPEDETVPERRFQSIELRAASSPMSIPNADGEPEVESLPDSPDDRSRGDASSSLHASSFTPGTSPTSVSSLDEDSDSSSPGHVRAGEGKQQRKARHRQPGQTLPTIEDSSEEDELREEEELLREQEKQKGSGKKSKKDKEEIRAQRRREHSKTPPSNLSPIEDASPTEELRQEAEMEEIRRSSCSDFSPSIDSDPEGLEIHAAKIAAVQKSYQLPTSASLRSPTDEQQSKQKPTLKSADEAYEEIMLKASSPTFDKAELQTGRESLYGGMLIEDYAYTSLIDNSTEDPTEPEKIVIPAQPRKLRSPDEVYEDMIKKRKEFMQLEQEYQKMQPKKDPANPEIVLHPATDPSAKSSTLTLGKDGKPLLDAEAAYEELMKKVLTPGSSPTQQEPEVEATGSRRALHPIPDLKVTQCSSGELSSDEDSICRKDEETPEGEPPMVSSAPSDQQSEPIQADVVDQSEAPPRPAAPVMASASPLATVPQYTSSTPSLVSTAPPVPPKPNILLRGNSQEKTEVAVGPPMPPPTPPKPAVFPRKPPVPLPPQASTSQSKPDATSAAQAPPPRQASTPVYKPNTPPPVPPKPSIPTGEAKPGHGAKPPIAPKPGSHPPSPAHAGHPPRPTVLPTCTTDVALNLSPSSESKPVQPSPKSPSSPRYARNLRDTYVVITLPSQPSSPVDSISTTAPSSPSPSSPSYQAQPPQSAPQSQPQQQPQAAPPLPPSRVPLAYTRVTESIESQEICGPEKHVSSSCHIIEAISASAQPPVVLPNLISQVVTTEVQRTTVSVVHERAAPPVPAPRANGVPISLEKPKPSLPAQNGQTFQPSEVVDLRTVKVDSDSDRNGVDLSAGTESRRQSLAADVARQNSAVQSPVVNLSVESSTVSIVTDSITIVTCSATIQQNTNIEVSQAASVPLQLTKNKSFEPISQIIYRPIDSQPSTHGTSEIPINLSVGSGTGGGSFQSPPVTLAPACAASVANGLTTGAPTVAGAVDLSTTKPYNTLVTMDTASAEVATAVVTDDDGKPVDLTAGKRAVCCDVVYKLPFAGSCTTQQATAPLPEDRFGYRDDHYQYERSPYGMRGFGGIKPSMSDTNLAEAGLFVYKSKNSYNFSGTTEGAVDLTAAKISDAGEAVDYSKKGACTGMSIPAYCQARATSAVGTIYGTSSVLRSSNGVVYSSVAAPIPSTYAITTQPGSIFSTSYNTLSGMHTSDTMPSLSNLENLEKLTRSHSFLSTISTGVTEEQGDAPLNLEISRGDAAVSTETTSLPLDTYTDASLEAIAASLEALSSPMVPGDSQYQAERERLEMEKLKQQRLAEELEWERQEIQRFREQEQLLVQKELEELQAMKQHILTQQEEERQAHLMMQKETYAQQQQQLEQIQRLQEQLRLQLEEQKLRQLYPGADVPGHGYQEAIVLGPDGTVLSRKITDSGCQTDEEDETVSKAYSAGRKKKSPKKSVDSCVQTDDEDQDEWEAQSRNRQNRPRTARGNRSGPSDLTLQAHTEISIQTDADGNIRMDSRMELSDSERTSPKKRPTPLEIDQSSELRVDSATLHAPKSPKVLYSPMSPCISPSKSLEFVTYDKSLGDTSPQKLKGSEDPSKPSPGSPRGTKGMQRSMSDPKSMSPTGEERASGSQYGDNGKDSGTQKKVKRTLPNPPSEEESSTSGQTAYTTNSARRRMCRNSNMARAKILQDIDRELDMVERESSKLRKRQAELDEEEKEIDAKLRYLEMGINRRKDMLLKEREKRERAYLQSVAEDRDYMSDSEVSNIREARGVHEGADDEEEIEGHGLERPRTAPQSELDDFVPPQTKHDYGKYSQYQYPQSQYQPFQTPQSYQSHSIYSSVPSLSSSQQQSYHQMLLLQQKAARQAALLSELDATKYEVISRQPDPASSAYLGVKYDKYGNHLDLRALEVGSMVRSPMSAVSDSYYTDVEQHTPRSYMLLEDAADLAKSSTGLSSSYSLAERELAKAEKLLRRSAADLGSAEYLGSTSRLHGFGKTPDEEDTMEEPYELKILKQQLKQEFRRSTCGTENLEQLAGLSQHYYTPPSTGISSYSQRSYPKTDKYSISRLTLEKQAAKQLPASMLYPKHKTPLLEPKLSSKYSSISDSRGLDSDYTSYLGSTSASSRSSRLSQDEITFGLRKNIAEQQKYLGSTLGANLAGSLNLGQSLGLDSAYPSGSRSRPSSRPTSCYGLDLSIKRDPSSSSLRLKGDGDSGDGPSYQTPSGRMKPTSLPIVQSGRGRIPIVAQNSEEESPLSPVGQPMGMARASAGPLPPISADSRDQFGSCLSLQDSQQQQHMREEPTRGRDYVLLDDLQGTMSDSEALSDALMALNRDDATNAYHLRREETDWFDKPRDGRLDSGQERRQGKGSSYPFPHLRVKLQRDPKDRSVSGNGLGIRVVGGKEVPGSDGEIGAYVAKVLPGGAAEQTGKILEGMQVLEWNGVLLVGKTYEEVQALVGQPCNEADVCVRLDLNMLADSEGSAHLEFQEHGKSSRPPKSPGVDPKQLAAELQKVSQQQAPSSTSGLAASTSATSSPGQPGSPSISKKRHSSKSAEGTKSQSHPVSGEIQLQIHYDKQLGNLIVHVLQARNLSPRDNNGYSDPFVKVYLLPGRGQVMVVQNASAENKRRSKHAGRSLNPEWNQTVIYKNILLEQLRKKTLEVSVWDYDKGSSNDFLGEVLIDLSNTSQLDNVPRWLPLKEQSEGEHHRRSHAGRSHGSSKPSSQHSSPKTAGSAHDVQDSPRSSVIKSRSHGIFPDPAKDTVAPPTDKSQGSPGAPKPSPSEGQSQSRSHGHGQHARSRSAAKSGARQQQQQQDGSGCAVTTGDVPQPPQQQQQQSPRRLPPSRRGLLSLMHQRHSVVGVLTLHRAQSDWLPASPAAPPGSRTEGRHLTLRKAVSEERPQKISGARSSYRSGDAPVTAASLDSGLSGSAYSLLDEEEEANEVDSAIFQVPRFGKIPNGTDVMKTSMGHSELEGKSQVMGEIKIALKKEVKTEGDHLVLEILQCRNITYKFKSPDHLPDLYVKLYVVNIATQKRIIKKKTRVCRHDREPSFNETFRFCMNPTGHALQLFLVSNGGKFVKKTLIGEAYVWLDKVDLRKRVVSWHKLLASTAQIHS